MTDFDFTNPVWNKDKEKPFDRLAPFRRIDVPVSHRFGPPSAVTPAGPFLRPDGKGYDCGCRSTTDYDGKVGEDLAAELSKVFTSVSGAVIDALKAGVKEFLGRIPFVGPLIKREISKVLDKVEDPLKSLFKKLGKLVDALLVDSFIRSLPSWVPALRREVADQDQKFPEQEVDGVLLRSYQRADSLPFTQWHEGYDWSFVVVPSPFFADIVGEGNSRRSDNDGTALFDSDLPPLRRYDADHPIRGANIDASIECEIDTGAITEIDPSKAGVPHASFLNPVAENGPREWRRDWGWPLTGQFFWAAGRSVYDCSHATDNNKAVGLHLNQLHPCKAFATARFEGFLFPDNERAVPAIQFMFFLTNAKRSGGDFKFDQINNVDYDFIVDLPDAPPAGVEGPDLVKVPAVEYPIGAAPRFLRNTLVIRPRLLVDVNFDRFADAAGATPNSPVAQIRPIVEPIPPANPDLAPRQIRVRIPAKQLKMSSAVATYGVMLTLGWHDPEARLARRVKRVRIRLDRMEFGNPKEAAAQRWILNIGINGRWMRHIFEPIRAPGAPPGLLGPFALRTVTQFADATLELFLAEDDAVSVSVHGFAEEVVGRIFDLKQVAVDANGVPIPDSASSAAVDSPASVLDALQNNFRTDRRLRGPKLVRLPNTQPGQTSNFQFPFIGRAAQWRGRAKDDSVDKTKADIDQFYRDANVSDDDKKKRASILARAMFLRLAVEGGFHANIPHGLIDPFVPDPTRGVLPRRQFDAGDTQNPLRIGDIGPDPRTGNRAKQCRLTAYVTEPFGRTAYLAYNPTQMDYRLFFTVSVDDQAPLPEQVGLPSIKEPTVQFTVDRVSGIPGIKAASVSLAVDAIPTIKPGSVRLTVDGVGPKPGIRTSTVTLTKI